MIRWCKLIILLAEIKIVMVWCCDEQLSSLVQGFLRCDGDENYDMDYSCLMDGNA